MSVLVVLLVLAIIAIAVSVTLLCTWSWWKRMFNQYVRSQPTTLDPTWPHPSRSNGTFEQLDPSRLDRPARGSTFIERLPNPPEIGFDPRESFELRRTRSPGVILASNDNSLFAHDWFHHPYESFPRHNLEYQKVIGKGWFGKVIEAKATNIVPIPLIKTVVVKQMRDDGDDHEHMRFLNECRVYRESGHANVLKLLGFSVEANPYLMILEYWPIGDLKFYLTGIEKSGGAPNLLKDGKLIWMALDIARGLEWLLKKGYVHEDLAIRNCLVASTAGKVIIGDYGTATQKYPGDYYRQSNYAIPIRWAAPETMDFTDNNFNSLRITEKSNTWSFGVVLWELFQFGKMPYTEMCDEDVIQRVIVSKTYLLEPPDFPYVQELIKEKLYNLMASCWNSSPENRPTMSEIITVLSTP